MTLPKYGHCIFYVYLMSLKPKVRSLEVAKVLGLHRGAVFTAKPKITLKALAARTSSRKLPGNTRNTIFFY